MKIIFFGSDDFALIHLEALASEHEIVACVTQPDKPKGRGMHLVPSPIKEWALKNKKPVLQPDRIKDPDLLSQLKEFQADLFIVIAYGKILPSELLQIPKICAINVHASLLPKYRGAAPINWAIINGEKETGLTIMKMSAALDAGDIIVQEKIKIEDKDTAATLREKLMKLGAPLLLKALQSITNHKAWIEQDSKQMTYAPKLTKELGAIDWNKPAQDIHNLVRGLQPWPGAYTFFKGKLLKVLESVVMMQDVSSAKPGTVIEISDEGFVVAAAENALLIKKIHLEASKPMDALAFMRGHKIEIGFKFE
jgi:methionyl-tRNA formyltransferase